MQHEPESTVPDTSAAVSVIAVSVGNTRISYAHCAGKDVDPSMNEVASESDAAGEAIARLAQDHDAEAIVIASVHEEHSSRLVAALRGRTAVAIYRVGIDVPLPIETRLAPDPGTGTDRFLAAIAAYDLVQQACVVVDAGTAITVDFVDGTGVFHGGAIAPGTQMALDALHERAPALPKVAATKPDLSDAFGRETRSAMLNGAYYGARGLVRMLTERYAEAYEAYPLVVVTGGDGEILFADDELVDRIVPNLVLRGIAIACHKSLQDDDGEE